MHLFPQTGSGWNPPVLTCSALENNGIIQIWDTVKTYIALTIGNGYFKNRRNDQAKYWMYETINEGLQYSFYHNHQIKPKLPQYEKLLLSNGISPFIAAHELLSNYFKTIGDETLMNRNSQKKE